MFQILNYVFSSGESTHLQLYGSKLIRKRPASHGCQKKVYKCLRKDCPHQIALHFIDDDEIEIREVDGVGHQHDSPIRFTKAVVKQVLVTFESLDDI